MIMSQAWSMIKFQAWNMSRFQACNMIMPQVWNMIMFQAWEMILFQAFPTKVGVLREGNECKFRYRAAPHGAAYRGGIGSY